MKSDIIFYLVSVYHWNNDGSSPVSSSQNKFCTLDSALEFYYANVSNLFFKHSQYSVSLYKFNPFSSEHLSLLKSDYNNL